MSRQARHCRIGQFPGESSSLGHERRLSPRAARERAAAAPLKAELQLSALTRFPCRCDAAAGAATLGATAVLQLRRRCVPADRRCPCHDDQHSRQAGSGCGSVTNCTHPRGAEDHDDGGAWRTGASLQRALRAFWQRARQRPAPPCRLDLMVWFGAPIPAEPLSLASTHFHAPPSCLAYQYHSGGRRALTSSSACATAPYKIWLV